jgi:hypothetical protein
LHRHEGDHVRRFSREAPHPEDVTVFTAGTPVIFRDSLMPQEDTPDRDAPLVPDTALNLGDRLCRRQRAQGRACWGCTNR